MPSTEVSSSRTPSQPPTISPTRSPTVPPSRIPSPSPTTQGQTLPPTRRPTTSPTSKPTVAIASSVPVIQSVGVSSTSVSSVALVNVLVSGSLYGGRVYCGVFSSPQMLTSVNDIKQQMKSVSTFSSSQTPPSYRSYNVSFGGLISGNTYYFYCYPEDALGNQGSLDRAREQGVQYLAPCCKSITYGTKSTVTALKTLEEYQTLDQVSLRSYSIPFSLSALPSSGSVTIQVKFYQSTSGTVEKAGVFANPSSFVFSSSDSSLSKSFLVFGEPGMVQVVLSSTGTEYASSSPLLVNITGTKLPPQVTQVVFDSSGQSLLVSFSPATDQGRSVLGTVSGIWNCSQLFEFVGSSNSGCAWVDLSTVKVFLNYFASGDLLQPDQELTLKSNVVRATCTLPCTNYPFASTMSADATVPQSHITANPILIIPSKISSCLNLTVDATQSTGNAGRSWRNVSWIVTGDDAGNALIVQNYLSKFVDTSRRFSIPATSINPGLYTVSLGLKNFLDDSTSPLTYTASQFEVVSDVSQAILEVKIDGSSLVSITRSQAIAKRVNTVLRNCDGVLSNAQYSYSWVVTRDGALYLNKTLSNDPSLFSAKSKTFQTGYEYLVTATVTAKVQEVTYIKSAQFTLKIVRGDVVSLINGAKQGETGLSVGNTFTVDGSMSYDADLTSSSSLRYAWTCIETTAMNYGSVCSFLSPSQQNRSVIIFAPSTFAPSSTYLFTLTVSSTVAGILKSSQSTLSVATGSSTASTIASAVTFAQPTSGTGLGSTTVLSATLSAENAITATWSLSSDSSAAVTSFTPLTRQFTQEDVATGIAYPLGLSSSMFVRDVSYTFRLTIFDGSEVLSYTEISITPNSAPYGGVITSSPLSGSALVTQFYLSTANWADFDLPLSYQFQYQVRDSFNTDSPTTPTGTLGSNVFRETTLPAGTSSLHRVICIVEAVDSLGSTSFASTIVVSTISQSDIENFYNDRYGISSAMAISSSTFSTYVLDTVLPQINADAQGYQEANSSLLVQESLYEASNLFSLLEQSNCSLAPTCSNLNRNSCSQTPHTCGPCLAGFTGVYGDSNYLCVVDNSDVKVSGQQCTASSQCEYGLCEGGQCVTPPKDCLVNKETNSVCSGHGVCKFKDFQSNSLVTCAVDDTSCVSFCDCESNFFGADCGLGRDDFETVSLVRGDYCDTLNSYADILDSSMASVLILADMMNSFFDPNEVVLLTPLENCAITLDKISLKLSATVENGEEITSIVAQVLTDLISKAVTTEQLSVLSNPIFNLLAEYQVAIHSSLVEGQDPLRFTSDNLRVSFRYDLLSELPGSKFTSPQTSAESYYASTPSIVTLPTSGLGGCNGFAKYGKFLLTTWGFTPFQIPAETPINGLLFSISPIETNDGSGYDGVDVSYSLSLPISEPIPADKKGQCYEINSLQPNSAQVCEFCDISSANSVDSNITLTCTNALDALCPAIVSSSNITRRALAESRFFNHQHTSRLLVGDQGDTYYTVGFVDAAVALRSYGSIPTKTGNRAVSTISTILFLVLVGAIILFFWDRHDRLVFIAARTSAIQNNPSMQFNLLDVFEETGHSEVKAPNLSAKPFSSRKGDHLALTDGSGVDQSTDVVKVSDVRIGDDDDYEEIRTSDLPETSLLSSPDWFTSFIRALKRHHRWIRVFTYPSLQKTRLIRFFVVCADVVSIIFATTLFYQIYFPDDETCEKKRYFTECEDTRSSFRLGEKLCQWDYDSNFCVLKPPPFNMFFIVTVSMIILVLSMPFRRFLQLVLEKVCSKRPILATQVLLQDEPALWGQQTDSSPVDQESQDVNSAFAMVGKESSVYRLAYCDSMAADAELNVLIASTKEFFNNTLAEVPIPWREKSDETEAQLGGRQLALMGAMMRWMGVHPDGTPVSLSLWDRIRFRRAINKMTYKIEKVRRVTRWVIDKVTEESNLASGQVDYQNNILLQEFVMEQLSPICRFAIKRDLFNLDNSLPGRLSFLKWILSWVFVFIATGFMSSWILYWAATNGGKVADAWGMTLFVVIVCDALMNEFFQIYFINVLVTDKLRPQINQIYKVFDHVMRSRLRDSRSAPNQSDVRIVQHTSAACRASRSPELNSLLASNILSLMDDADIAISRLKRLTRLFDIGLIAYLTLSLPSYLTDCYDIIQQTSLDMVLPLCWSCFLLLSFVLNRVHPALLGMFYFFLLLLFIFVVFIAPSERFKRLVHGEDRDEEEQQANPAEQDVESLRHQNLLRVESEQNRESMNPSDSAWRGMNNVTPGAYELTGFQIDLVEFDQEFAEQSMDGLFDSFAPIDNRKRRQPTRRENELHDDIMDSTTALQIGRGPTTAAAAPSSQTLVQHQSSEDHAALGHEIEEDEQGRVSVHTRDVLNEVQHNSIYLKQQQSQNEEEEEEAI